MYSPRSRSRRRPDLPRFRRVALLGITLASACGGGKLAPIVPVGLEPSSVAAVEPWIDSLKPRNWQFHRFRFQLRDDRGAAGGRGSAHVAGPDSLRFDVAGPFNSNRAAAVVVGDTALWAEPEEDVQRLVPNYPLLWAMLGVPLGPVTGAEVRRFANDRMVAWQFVHGADTVEYAWTPGDPGELIADVREGGKRIGRVTTKISASGALVSSRLIVPSGPARLDISYTLTRDEPAFEPDIWIRPAP